MFEINDIKRIYFRKDVNGLRAVAVLDRDYSAYSIVQAHTAEEAKAHFIRDDLKHRNVTVQVFPYKFGHWMDEDDWFDLSRETAVF